MSLVATAMQPLIEMYTRKALDKNEILFSRYGAHNLFLAMSGQSNAIMSSKVRTDAENSYGNVVKIPVLTGDTVSIGSTRSCTISDAESTSGFVQLTWTPLTWGFTMYRGQYVTGPQAINYIQYDSDLLHKADRCTLALMSTVDTLARNVIDTNINTYFPANITTSYYPQISNALQVSQAQKNDFFNQLSAIMEEYDFYNKTYILANPKLKTMTTRLEAQGAGNATNEAFQFMLGNFVFTSSNRVTNGSGIESTVYAIQEASIAIVNRNNPNARGGFKIGGGDTPVTQWGIMQYPLLGMQVGTFYTASCAATGGAVTDNATLKEGYGFDTEISWLTPYNSSPSTKQQSILKAEISAS